jgi:hypothetical protein
MPVVTHILPIGPAPLDSIRNEFVTWLEENVSSDSTRDVAYTVKVTTSTMFAQVLKEYTTAIGTDWPDTKRKRINRIMVVRSDIWTLWQVTALVPGVTGYYQAHQYAVYIEDEILALQFKLSCL